MANDQTKDSTTRSKWTHDLNVGDYQQDEQLRNISEFLKFSKLQEGEDWIGGEYSKHIQAVRDRYPMLTQLLMRPRSADNANLSDIKTTNKYARLADAYNAKYRYQPHNTLGGGLGEFSLGSATYEPVNKLETQDQKQMDQLRQAQADLRKYELEQESHFQQDYAKRKLNEMLKLVDQGYKQQFFDNEEQMRRVAELFNHWRDLDKYDFTETLTNMGIPRMQVDEMYDLISKGQYMRASMLANAHGFTPLKLEDIYTMTQAREIVAEMSKGNVDPQRYAQFIGELGANQVLYYFAGFLTAAEKSGDPDLNRLAQTVRSLVGSINTAAGDVGAIVKELTNLIHAMTTRGIELGGEVASNIENAVRSMDNSPVGQALKWLLGL
jgi:hypothetical protein